MFTLEIFIIKERRKKPNNVCQLAFFSSVTIARKKLWDSLSCEIQLTLVFFVTFHMKMYSAFYDFISPEKGFTRCCCGLEELKL